MFYCIIQVCAVRSVRGPAGEYQSSGCIDETVSSNYTKDLETRDHLYYYIPINDTSFERSVFWPSDTESRINELHITILKNEANVGYLFCGKVT